VCAASARCFRFAAEAWTSSPASKCWSICRRRRWMHAPPSWRGSRVAGCSSPRRIARIHFVTHCAVPLRLPVQSQSPRPELPRSFAPLPRFDPREVRRGGQPVRPVPFLWAPHSPVATSRAPADRTLPVAGTATSHPAQRHHR
jgi:hypothetical protein